MEDYDGPILEINLGAIVRNWQLLRATHQGKNCAAVVKANAYGLGVDHVAAALADAGCTHFFVATLSEAVELRQLISSAFIYVFNGVQEGETTTFLDYNIIPVLNDWPQFERWEEAAKDIKAASSALHVDTGMNRLGFSIDDAQILALEPERLKTAQTRLLMSHLACAGEPEHPLNAKQLAEFSRIRQCFPHLPASFANSSGIFLSNSFHHDLARPGCALYGITPNDALPNPMEQVATLNAPILQVRTTTKESEPVGYGGNATMPKGSKLATVALGYADGWLRILSHTDIGGYFGTHFAPMVGRVSMDLVILDVTHIPAALCTEGSRVQFICPQQDVNKVAAAAQTIGYEVFTSLKARVNRQYIQNSKVS